MADEEFMRLAIDKAREGVLAGQTPFGACIVLDGSVISVEHNRVWEKTDPTAHAEVEAIRVACRKLGKIDLTGCVIYSTCEPCPMCFSACHWARIGRVVYGTSIEDAKKIGFNEFPIHDETMKEIGGSDIEIERGFLRDECVELFRFWSERKDKKKY